MIRCIASPAPAAFLIARCKADRGLSLDRLWLYCIVSARCAGTRAIRAEDYVAEGARERAGCRQGWTQLHENGALRAQRRISAGRVRPGVRLGAGKHRRATW